MKHPAAFLLLLATLTASSASATTYVLVNDPALADQAPVIAEVRVVSVDRAAATATAATDYLVEIEDVLKGFVPGGSVIVRVPGGQRVQEGVELRVFGAPRFAEGSRALLFLKPRKDGTFGVLHLFQGAFHVVRVGSESFALRQLAGTAELQADGSLVERQDQPRNLEPFRRWLKDRANGLERAVDYFATPSDDALGAISAAFTLIDIEGLPVRWTQFDRGSSVPFSLHEGGQPGLPNLGIDAFQAAMAGWNNDSGTPIRLRYNGTTSATGGLSDFDNVNAILFNDPNDDPVFDSPFSCTSGGVIAAAGPWVSLSNTHPWNGDVFRTISGADIVTNKGIDCWIGRNRRGEEVFAHELGHTLGLGHSCGDDESGSCNTSLKNQALMRAQAHGDNRGAALNNDDREAICFLYGSACEGGGGGGGGTVPAAPSSLTGVAQSFSSVRLDWLDNAGDETQFQLERRAGNAGFDRIATLAANTQQYLDTGLTGNTAYTYRVRARNDAGNSAYSNQVNVTTPSNVPPPSAPSNTTAEAIASSQIRVSWTDTANNETGFEIEVKTTGAYKRAKTVAANTGSTIVTDLFPYTTHTFRVRAVNAGGGSAYSNEVVEDTFPTDGSPPTAPDRVLAVAASRTEIFTTWRDNASNEIGYEVEISSGGAFTSAGKVGRNVRELLVGGLVAGVNYQVRVKALGVLGDSATSQVAAAITAAGSACVASANVACQLGGRFKVEVQWRNQRNGQIGRGTAQALSDLTSTFWFFSAENTEIIAKVLDGRGNNGHFWFFSGSLTDVEHWITLSDTVSGEVRLYRSAPGDVCGNSDTRSIAAASSTLTGTLVELEAPSLSPDVLTAAAGTCVDSSQELCLLDDRFRVEVDWLRPNGVSGPGIAVPSTNNTGLFWFFNAANIELVVKMLDGTTNNGKFWVFYGALSNVRYEIKVTDTMTGATRTYVNPQGEVCGRADLAAF